MWHFPLYKGSTGVTFLGTPLQNGPCEKIFYSFTTCFQQHFELDNICFDGTTRFLVFVIVIDIVIVIFIETIRKTKKTEGRPKEKMLVSKSWSLDMGVKNLVLFTQQPNNLPTKSEIWIRIEF